VDAFDRHIAVGSVERHEEQALDPDGQREGLVPDVVDLIGEQGGLYFRYSPVVGLLPHELVDLDELGEHEPEEREVVP
jgi:hypothetical protein